jgi:hypothetical protein
VLIAAADASIERFRVRHDPGGSVLADSARGSKSLGKGLELSGQTRWVAGMIGALDCIGREPQMVRRVAVCSFWRHCLTLPP